MGYLLIKESELDEICRRGDPKSERQWSAIQSIRSEIMQRVVPPDAVGFVHPSKWPDGKYMVSLFPKEWK